MKTKFSVGDKVAVIGIVDEIRIDKNGEQYLIKVADRDGFPRDVPFEHSQLFPASDLFLEEDDLK